MINIVSLMYYAYYNPVGSPFMIKRDHIPMKSPQRKQITCTRTIPLIIYGSYFGIGLIRAFLRASGLYIQIWSYIFIVVIVLFHYRIYSMIGSFNYP